MPKNRALGIVSVAFVAVIATALPALAWTYYITGWQTNGGWNSLDDCVTYRRFVSPGDRIHAHEEGLIPPYCARDIGVRGKGNTTGGGVFEYGTISWDVTSTNQYTEYNWRFTAMKVYHGTHP